MLGNEDRSGIFSESVVRIIEILRNSCLTIAGFCIIIIRLKAL